MKKNIILAAAAAAVVSVSSCTGFLNVETLGKSTIEGFFSDIDGLKTAGVGLHRTILDFYDNVYLRFADIAEPDHYRGKPFLQHQ